MSLFKGKEIKDIERFLGIFEDRLNAADSDRRRIKDNADKFGGLLTDLECRIGKLEVARSHGKKHKH